MSGGFVGSLSLSEFTNFNLFWEDLFSGKYKVWTFLAIHSASEKCWGNREETPCVSRAAGARHAWHASPGEHLDRLPHGALGLSAPRLAHPVASLWVASPPPKKKQQKTGEKQNKNAVAGKPRSQSLMVTSLD